jgi:pimeloyl-ACP methyl ester carboxylesterase
VRIAVAHESLNDGGPTVLLGHATGFCKEVWRPVIEDLGATGLGVDVVSFDQRGHGNSSPFPRPLDWWNIARDVLNVLDGRREVIGVGHSSGGTALTLAEILAPGTFRSLVLVEPIIPPPPFKRNDVEPMAVAALKRTRTFVSRAAADERLRGRGAFAGWDERAFAGYLEGGLHRDPASDSGGVVLACDPQDEAEFFQTLSEHRAWSHLGEIGPPVELIAGEESESHTPRRLGLLTSRMQLVTVTWVPHANHFVPQQRPDVIVAAVAAAVSGEWAD